MKIVLLSFNAILLTTLTLWGWQGWVRVTEADFKVDVTEAKVEALNKKVKILESNIKLREKTVARLEQESMVHKATTDYLYAQIDANNAKIENFQEVTELLKKDLENLRKPSPAKKPRRLK